MANRTEWQAALDRCVGAYYDGDLRAGLAACETVLAAADVPDDTREQVLRNEIFYAPPLRDLVDTFVHRQIDLPLPAGWFPLNPSIARDGDGFLAIVRAVNYELAGPGRWIIHDPDGISTTENYLVRFDRELRPTSVRPIADETPTGPRCPCPYAGLEDCRLVRWQDRWVASCGVVDRHPSCMGHIAVADLDDDAGAFRDLRILSEIDSRRWEKNWMPFTDGDDLLFVYRIGPTEILRYDPDRRATTPLARHWAPPLAALQKGGSQGVRVGDGWLFSVHQSADFREGNRCYLHRWARLDASYRLTHLSGPFVLLDGGVEFCSGLALDGDRLVASFGSGDRAAHLLALSLVEIDDLLLPIGVSGASAFPKATERRGVRSPYRAALCRLAAFAPVHDDGAEFDRSVEPVEAAPIIAALDAAGESVRVARLTDLLHRTSTATGFGADLPASLPDALTSYLLAMRSVEGWLHPTTALATNLLMSLQHDLGYMGDALEIGVHHGRYLIVLALSLMENERAIAIDLFSRQAENIDRSGLGDLDVLRANVARFATSADVEYVAANSLELGEDFVAARRGVRFVSIDGGHSRANVLNDLVLTERLLGDGGIAALDDIYRPDWSGVTAGLDAYYRGGGGLVPFAIVPNKVLLTTSAESAEVYADALRRTMRSFIHPQRPLQEFFRFDGVVSFAETTNLLGTL